MKGTGDGSVLLTGATGFVGMELLARVLEQTDREVVALVRASDNAAAAARIDDLLTTLIEPGRRPSCRERVLALAADLEQPALGWSEATRAHVTANIGAVVHCAASVSLALDLATARRVNVGGTREILSLAREARERGSLDRVVHVSTAYVAGERSGIAREREGDVGQAFRNTYERTKLEAEDVVRASGLPAAILRPSIVVGDSVTGWIPAFNFIYGPLQAFTRGVLTAIPFDPDARLDIVPVDVVADALLELLCGPVRGGTFHVVAGDEAITNERFATLGAAFCGMAAPRFVATGADPSADARIGVLMPYANVRCVFDTLRGRGELGAHPPPLGVYLPRLLSYAREADWGKSPLARWAVGNDVWDDVSSRSVPMVGLERRSGVHAGAVTTDATAEGDERMRAFSSSESIGDFYDLTGAFFASTFGQDIHFGIWDDDDKSSMPAAQARLTDRLIDLLGLESNEYLLDVGCGTGHPAIQLAERTQAKVLGVSISAAQVKRASAESQAAGHSSRLEFIRADAMSLPCASETFDAAWAIEMLFHVPDRAQVLGEMYRTLKPGGRVVLTDFVERQPLTREEWDLLAQMFAVSSLLRFEQYAEAVSRCGFEAVEVQDVTAQTRQNMQWIQSRYDHDRERLSTHYGPDAMARMDEVLSMGMPICANKLGYVIVEARRPEKTPHE